MTEFDDRLEGEIKTHESEMLKKALVHKYGDKPLLERILYVMNTYPHDSWTINSMFEKLNELGLAGTSTAEDIKKLFADSTLKFSSKVGN